MSGRWDNKENPLGKKTIIIGVGVLMITVFTLMGLYIMATPINPSGTIPPGNCDPTTGQCQTINDPSLRYNIQVNH